MRVRCDIEKSLAGVALLALCATAIAGDATERTTVSFSDPSRPGTLRVDLVQGSIIVKGTDLKNVVVEAHASPVDEAANESNAPPGLRQIPQQPSISIEEQDNRMSIGSPNANRAVNLEVQVPRQTNLRLSTVNGGDIRVEGVDGALEISNVNGSIGLSQVSGSVVAHTVNGNLTATLTGLNPQAPSSFTSHNGSVDVTLPASVRATLKLHSEKGSVFTDFEMTTVSQSAPKIEDTRQSGGRYRVEVSKEIHGAVNGGGTDIELRTFTGDIYLRRAPDPRTGK